MATNASTSISNASMGSRIKELRKQAKISQQELADIIGVSRAAISLFEIGTSKPSSETLAKLADALQVDMGYLLGRNQVLVAKASKHVIAASSNTLSVQLPFFSISERSLLLESNGKVAEHINTLLLSTGVEENAIDYTSAIVLEVGEDNMEPLLHTGDKVIAWPIPESKWGQVYNQVCVVAFDETVTIKAVRENELLTRDILTLHAQNAVAGFLPVQRQQIKAIWRVEEFFERPKIRL